MDIPVFVGLGGFKALEEHRKKQNTNSDDHCRHTKADKQRHLILRISGAGKFRISDQFLAKPKGADTVNKDQADNGQELTNIGPRIR